MKNNITEMVFILDRSGSMYGAEADVVGGFNSMLTKQKQEEGRAYVTTVLFNDGQHRLHDRLDMDKVTEMKLEDFVTGGCTALLDTVGDTIKHIIHIHRYARPEDVPEKTIMVIATDGMDNTSRRFTAEQVRKLIEHEKEKYGWEFIFLGANIDAVETAGSIGISHDRAVNFNPDDEGLELCFNAVSDVVSSVQHREPVNAKWSARIAADHSARKSKR